MFRGQSIFLDTYVPVKTQEGGWNHPSWPDHCITISILLSMSRLGMNLKQLKPLSIQTTKVVSFVPLNNVLHSISNAYKVKLKLIFKTCSKCTSRFNHKSKLLCIPHHFVAYLSNGFERRWYTKPNNIVKVVKDLPHMFPWHKPNPKRGLVMCTRWITVEPNYYLCHTIKYIIIIYFVSFNTHTTTKYSTCSLAIWTLCDQKLREVAYTSHKSATLTLIP